MVLVVIANQVGQTRIAVIAGRSIGKAVRRNRVKRLTRAAISPYIETIKPGWDILLIARRPAGQVDFSTIYETLGALLKRANLIKNFNDQS